MGKRPTQCEMILSYIEKHGSIDKKATIIAAVVCAVLLAVFIFVAKSVI